MRKANRRIAMPGRPWILFPVLLLLVPAAAAAANLASVSVNPKTIASGSPLELTFALDGPAPSPFGATVMLRSSHATFVNMPPEWGVLAGTTSNSIVFRETGYVSTTTLVTITASYGGVSKTATVTVKPRVPVRGAAGDLWADVVLGQPDFSEITFNEVSSRRVFNPAGVLVDRSFSPNRVYVFDANNSRILGFSHLGTCQGLPSLTCTTNSDCGAGGTCAVQEGRGADLVLGQPSFDRSACNGDGGFQRFPIPAPASAATFCSMREDILSISESFIFANMAVDGSGNVYVPDILNNRVLRYNSPFATGDTIADDVWGQADFTAKECNRGRGLDAPDSQSLCFEGIDNAWISGVAIDPGGNLWVADNANNRVLRFPCCDSGTGKPRHTADLVLGQQGFNSSASGEGLNQMNSPAAVRMDSSGSVYVADALNSRVLIFDAPLINGKSARRLDFDFGVAPSGTPTGLELDPAGGMWVHDSSNNQLLLFVGGAVQKVLFKDVPTSSGGCGGDFLGDGAPFFYDDGTVWGSWRLCITGGGVGVDSAGNVFASGMEPQDVWRFSAPFPAPTSGIAHSADARLFKPYQFGMPNEVGLGGFYSGIGVAVAADQLIMSDAGRLLYWNNPPSLTSGQPADGFVGSPDSRLQSLPFFGRIREDAASRLWAIRGDKILTFSLPLRGGDDPTGTISSPLPVLGGGTLTWNIFLVNGGIAPVGPGDKVWIADPVHNRVFRIRDALTTPVVDIVLGQLSADGTACNQGDGTDGLTRTSLCNPGAIRLDPQGNLYVSDHALESSGNFRLLEYDATLFPDSPPNAVFGIPASRVFGTEGSFNRRLCGTHEVCGADWEPAFSSNGQMVVGGNGYLNPRFPYVYTNPLVSQHVDNFLNDFSSMGYSATFDSSDNLYVTDSNRSRVLIYLNPLSSPPPAPFTLTVSRTGSGSGTIVSTPFGIDCGTACSQPYIKNAVVTLSALPDTNFVFAGWSGDADCADSVVTMSANKTCTARFDPPPDLIVSALTVPSTGGAGLAIGVSSTTKNQTGSPAPASTTRFSLSTDATWDAGDVLLGSRAIPALASGAVSTGSTSLTIPAGTLGGSYFVIARADADNVVFETIETNNNASAPIAIGPDLIVSVLTAPASAVAGSTISVTSSTKNLTGTSPATPSTTRFYLSTDTTWDAGDAEIGSRAIPALAAGVTNSGPANVTMPAGTPTGNYSIIARADGDGTLFEVNETNNTKYASIRVSPPDLIVSAISVPTTGGAGLPITATNTTKNQTNTGPAPASTTRFYLSSNSTWEIGDTLIGSQAVGALAAGASEAHSTTLNIPAGKGPGTWYVIARADADGLIPETLDTNNTASDTIVLGPDLIVSALTVPANGGAGLPITVSSTTKNQGGGAAAASTTMFYLSANNTYGIGDVWLGDRAIGSLNPGLTSAGPTTLTIPAGTAAGSYYILALADDPNVVPETIETNNTTAALIKLSPDLIVSVLGAPTSAAAGVPITVTDTTKNQGQGIAAASITKLYLSTNNIWEAGDTEIGSRAVGQLASGATSAGSTSVTIPTAGSWYILAKADAPEVLAEASETNNVLSRAITITPLVP